MIKIGFSYSHSWTSSLIRWITRSKVSHAFIYIQDDFLGEIVIQSANRGVDAISFSNFKLENTVVKMIEPKVSIDKGLIEAANDLGAKYDYAGLFGNLFVIAAKWFKHKIRNPFASPKAFICTELVVVALQAAGYPGADQLERESTTPEALLEFMEQ